MARKLVGVGSVGTRAWVGQRVVEGQRHMQASSDIFLSWNRGPAVDGMARAQARSGDRVAIAAYLGAGPSADHALSEFAETYADRNDRDYELFEEAAKAGRIEVVRGI